MSIASSDLTSPHEEGQPSPHGYGHESAADSAASVDAWLARNALTARIRVLLLIALLIATIVTATLLGAYPVTPLQAMRSLLAQFVDGATGAGVAHTVLWEIRWPRVALALAVGASLAVVGVGIQGIFRNPLAAPEVIGTSAGAALGAAFALVGVGSLYTHIPESLRISLLPFAAFIGALLATLAVYRLGTRSGSTDVVSMLLAGIGVNALSFAVVGLATAVSSDTELRSLTQWMLGSLSGSSWTRTLIVGIVTLLFSLGLWKRRHALDALLLGEAEAFAAGEDPRTLKLFVVLGGSACLAVSVAFTGMISFIGLVVPHAMRTIFGVRHKMLIPTSALAGAWLLLAADTLGRTVIAPQELPPGVLTGVLGAPVFLWLLRRVSQRGGS